MADEATIQKQIESAVEGKYAGWRIGITDNPTKRKADLGNPLHWLQWEADSVEVARRVADHFVNKGMASATGPDPGRYVYILPSQAP